MMTSEYKQIRNKIDEVRNNITSSRKPLFIMMCGLPACGKSTLRSSLNIDNEFIEVSSDDYIEKYAKAIGRTYSEVFRDYVKQAELLLNVDVKNAVKNQQDFIWDQTNLTPKARGPKLALVTDDYFKLAIWVTCDPDRQLERLENRGGGKFIPRQVIESMVKSAMPPTKNEGFDLVLEYNTN